MNEKYYVRLKKQGFHIIWNLSEETISLFKEKLEIDNLKFIFCHMQIWNKSFYEKHKNDKLNKDYNENEVLNNIERKLKRILMREDFEIHKNWEGEKRIILKDIYKHEKISKNIQYNFVFSYNNNDDKIYMITLHRKK